MYDVFMTLSLVVLIDKRKSCGMELVVEWSTSYI